MNHSILVKQLCPPCFFQFQRPVAPFRKTAAADFL